MCRKQTGLVSKFQGFNIILIPFISINCKWYQISWIIDTIISKITVMVPTSVVKTSSFDLVDDKGGECYNIRKKAQSAKTVASEL